MFLHHKLNACHYLEDWNPQLATFFSWLDPHASDGCKPRMSHSFLFPALLSLSVRLSLSVSPPPPEQFPYTCIKFHCSDIFAAVALWDLISFRKLRCNIRCQFNCQHCKQVSGLSLVYLHLHHFLHRLQDSSMVFGAILHHVWSLCNHFEANDIVGVLAGSPVCFLIFSSLDLRNDMPHLLFAEVHIYCSL